MRYVGHCCRHGLVRVAIWRMNVYLEMKRDHQHCAGSPSNLVESWIADTRCTHPTTRCSVSGQIQHKIPVTECGRLTAAHSMLQPLPWECELAARQGASGNVITNSPEPGCLRHTQTSLGGRLISTLLGVLRLPGRQPAPQQYT